MASWMIDPTDWYPTVGVAVDGPTASRKVRRCPSLSPGGETLLGKRVRCEERIGHTGQHGHSFAARYWDDAS